MMFLIALILITAFKLAWPWYVAACLWGFFCFLWNLPTPTNLKPAKAVGSKLDPTVAGAVTSYRHTKDGVVVALKP